MLEKRWIPFGLPSELRGGRGQSKVWPCLPRSHQRAVCDSRLDFPLPPLSGPPGPDPP